MYGFRTALGEFTFGAALAALIFSHAPPAAAHARWDLNGVVKPRNTSTGLKTDPCGGATRTTTPVTFIPGQTLEVSFEETINHASHFRIAFSPQGDLNFNNNVLLDNIPDNMGMETPLPHLYRAVITLPTQACDACTLQLIQVMTDNPAAPSNYYSCSDIKLAGGGTTPTPTPTPTTPLPTPPPALIDLKQIAQNLLEDFAVADADKSNALTLDEAQSILPGLTSTAFSKLDANTNGTVSQAELNTVINPPKPATNASAAASMEWIALLGLLPFALRRRSASLLTRR